MRGKIAYKFETPVHPGNILYVNLIARYSCINDCRFCSRPRRKDDVGKPNVYEKKAGSLLYLPKSPSVGEIIQSIEQEVREGDKELAIIGLGEPLIYLPKVIEVIREVKERYPVKTRVDTDGLVKCMYEDPARQLDEAGLDEIRISLNETNEEDYNQLCRPKLKDAFPNLVSFVKDCLDSRIETYVSFVVGFDDGIARTKSPKDYTSFAISLGIKPENIIFRDYVEPIKT